MSLNFGTDKRQISGNANVRDLSLTSLGQLGAKRITGTDAVTPDVGYVFTILQAEEDTIIDEVEGNLNLNGASILAEGIRVGRFTSVKLTSGTLIAYQGV